MCDAPMRLACLRGRKRLWLLPLATVGLGCNTGTELLSEAQIDFDFPGASLAYAQPLGGNTFQIALKDDTNATTKLWFSFRVREAQGRALTFYLVDAGTVDTLATTTCTTATISGTIMIITITMSCTSKLSTS